MKKPKFELGQKVKYRVSVKVQDDITISDTLDLYVAGITISSNADSQIFEYTLAQSLPDAYYGGKGFFHHVKEGNIS